MAAIDRPAVLVRYKARGALEALCAKHLKFLEDAWGHVHLRGTAAGCAHSLALPQGQCDPRATTSRTSHHVRLPTSWYAMRIRMP